MTVMKVSYENVFLVLQDGAPPVMSPYIITEIWLHKGSHFQKHFRERTSLMF